MNLYMVYRIDRDGAMGSAVSLARSMPDEMTASGR